MHGRVLIFIMTFGLTFLSFLYAAPVPEKKICTGKKEIIMGKNALLIDVRTPEEFASSHLKGAINIPGGDPALLQKKGVKKDTQLFLYCRSGRRVKAAVKILKKEGYTCLYDFGGINSAGKRLGLPTVK